MKLLLIGGTVFLGRHIAAAALARGHEVTLFTRGLHNGDLFPEAEHLRGDRDGDLGALAGRRWDAVIDTSGYVPRVVRQSAELLVGAVDHYTFISTLSVYLDLSVPGIDESGPVGTLEDETVEEITGETYGPLKVLCERVVQEVMPGRSLVIRPGLIVGPYDPTDRFTYWPHRVAEGGTVLAPGNPDARVRFTDVRDLAEWTLRMVEARRTGLYNADGPGIRLSMGRLLDMCREVSGSDATFRWLDDTALLEAGVEPWMGLPLWIPETPETRGFSAFDSGRAIAAGLTFRPVEETIRATLEWDRTRGEHEWRAGISREREREILANRG